MTLPLSTQDRGSMQGARYEGAIASVHLDIEYPEHWDINMDFMVDRPPPFPWAGQTTTEEDRTC